MLSSLYVVATAGTSKSENFTKHSQANFPTLEQPNRENLFRSGAITNYMISKEVVSTIK
jgi:hypothetical protein